MKNHRTIVVVLFLIIIALIVLGVFYSRRDQNSKQFNSESLSRFDAKSTSADIKVDTTGWKTYSNAKYGFTFQYPPNLELTDPSIGLVYTLDANYSFTALSIGITPNPQHLTAEEFLKQAIEDGKNCTEVCGWSSNFEKTNKIQSNGNTFYGIVGGFTGELPSVDIYYLSDGDKLIDFEIADFSGGGVDHATEIAVSKEMYQVLNTFKFIK